MNSLKIPSPILKNRKRVQRGRDQLMALLGLLKVKIQSMMHMFNQAKLFLELSLKTKKVNLILLVHQTIKIKSILRVSNKSINKKQMLAERQKITVLNITSLWKDNKLLLIIAEMMRLSVMNSLDQWAKIMFLNSIQVQEEAILTAQIANTKKEFLSTSKKISKTKRLHFQTVAQECLLS